MFRRRMLVGGMIAGGMAAGVATGAVVGHYSSKRQFESMQRAQAQQAQLNQARAQAQQAELQAAQITSQAQAPKEDDKDVTQELEKLAKLKQQGILSEEEFQQMKGRILSRI